jgi:hypothetical protein
MSSVDVVVPCYNYGHYLKACVDSVLSQRDVDVRVLIIDDKSTDDSATVGQALAAADPRVTFRRHEVNKGLIATANEGIEWVTAPYYVLLSADDALTPGALARAVGALERHPEAGMVYGIARIVRGDDGFPALDDALEPTVQIVPGREFLRYVFEQGNPVPSPCAVVRTTVQHRIGGYCSKFPHTSDLEMWLRIAVHAPIATIREPQAYYRQHNQNMTLEFTGGALSDRRERLATYEYAAKAWAESVPELDGWLKSVKDELGREALWRASTAYERGDREVYTASREFAMSCAPHLRFTRAWWRLVAMIALGPRAMRSVRNLKKSLRGVQSSPATAPPAIVSSLEWGSWPSPPNEAGK